MLRVWLGCRWTIFITPFWGSKYLQGICAMFEVLFPSTINASCGWQSCFAVSCISGRCTNSGRIILYDSPILQATFRCEISKVSNPGITPLKLRLVWIGKSYKRPIACTKQTTQWTQICIDSRIRRNSKQNDCIAENTWKSWIHSLQTLPITIGLNLNTPTHPHTRTFNLC